MNTARQMVATRELQVLGAKLHKVRAESEAWPMLVFEDVLTAADRWDVFGRGSGHKTINGFLREYLGGSWNLGRFKRVRDVVGRIGEHARRTWSWPAAQWAYNCMSDDELRVALDSYPMWMKRNAENPLSLGMLRVRVKEMRAGEK